MLSPKLSLKGVTIHGAWLYAYLGDDGLVHVGSDDIPGFGELIMAPTDSENAGGNDLNLRYQLQKLPPGERFRFPVRIRFSEDRDNFTIYCDVKFGPKIKGGPGGGFRHTPRRLKPTDTALRAVYSELLTALMITSDEQRTEQVFQQLREWAEQFPEKCIMARHQACGELQDLNVPMERAFAVLDRYFLAIIAALFPPTA